MRAIRRNYDVEIHQDEESVRYVAQNDRAREVFRDMNQQMRGDLTWVALFAMIGVTSLLEDPSTVGPLVIRCLSVEKEFSKRGLWVDQNVVPTTARTVPAAVDPYAGGDYDVEISTESYPRGSMGDTMGWDRVVTTPRTVEGRRTMELAGYVLRDGSAYSASALRGPDDVAPELLALNPALRIRVVGPGAVEGAA